MRIVGEDRMNVTPCTRKISAALPNATATAIAQLCPWMAYDTNSDNAANAVMAMSICRIENLGTIMSMIVADRRAIAIRTLAAR